MNLIEKKKRLLFICSLLSFLSLTLLLGFSAAGSEGPEESAATVFRNVNVVPMDREVVLKNMTVVVRGDKIAVIGKTEDVAVPHGANMIDGQGKYLLPGLMDMHVHLDLDSDRRLGLYLAHGVTTVRNMAGTSDTLELRTKIATGELLGPAIYTSGPTLVNQDYGVPQSFHASTRDVAREEVRRLKREGYDWVKIVRLDRDVFEAVLDEARLQEMPVGGHLPSLEWPLEEIYTSGLVSHEHIKEVFTSQGGTDRTCDESRIRELARVARAANLSVSSIIQRETVFRQMWQQKDDYLTAEQVEEIKKYTGEEGLKGARDYIENAKEQSVVAAPQTMENVANETCTLKILKYFFEEGVNVVVGTDSHLFFAYGGITLHEELDLFLKAGLTPFEALRTVTKNPAKLLAAEDRLGTLAVGKAADLVLADGNPLEDISALRTPAGVMVRGRWLSREDLDRLLPK